MGNIFSWKEELYSAVESSDISRIYVVLKAHPDLLNEPMTSDCKTMPLSRAAWRGDMKLCQFLIDVGADVND